MQTQRLHRGRLIDHLHLVVADLDASQHFYEAVLGSLGVPIGGELDYLDDGTISATLRARRKL